MQKRHQQRLVGAVVIVALAVIFLPMLLRGPVDRQALDLPMEIPPEPRGREAVEAPRDEEPPMLDRIPVREPEDEEAAEPDDELAMPDQLPGDEPVAPAEEPDVVEAPEVASEPEEEPETAEPATDEEPEPEETAEAEAEPVEAEGFAVQVGSFRSEGNAIGLRDRLRDEGLPAFVVESSDSDGAIYRLRVGPVPSRDEARDLVERVRQDAGVDSIVVRHP
ncbi:SPOR domain-containing protein [Methylonatrum kenyense]|uniref:SPOR domain-containing protein n=1 Tax=Methylonatrum kenyense TaxID=455253 RepID=UPI0020BE93D9|nr:SPOR domain-containing protein [Methylonatrum kenyense]MCK8514849.1 SPOR domain-containing protein [Methylonatrum kenyense]